MEIDAIIKLINTTGFPIACCVAMYIQNIKFQKTIEELKIAMHDLIATLKSEG